MFNMEDIHTDKYKTDQKIIKNILMTDDVIEFKYKNHLPNSEEKMGNGFLFRLHYKDLDEFSKFSGKKVKIKFSKITSRGGLDFPVTAVNSITVDSIESIDKASVDKKWVGKKI